MKQISMNNRIMLGLIAIVLLFIGICLSVGTTYSRYQNEQNKIIVWNGEADSYTYEFLENTTYVSPSSVTLSGSSEKTTEEETAVTEISDATAQEETEGMRADEIETETEELLQEDMVSETSLVNTQDSTEDSTTDIIAQNEESLIENGLTTIKNPSKDGITLLKIQFPENCNKAVLSLDSDKTFFLGIRYSYDGQTGYQLNQAGYIELDGSGEILLLLETPDSIILNGETRTIRVTYFQESVNAGYSETQITRGTGTAWEIALASEKKIMGKKGELQWEISNLPANSNIELKFEYLTNNGYTSIPVKNSIIGEVSYGDDAVKITARNSEDKEAQAGTYRMVVSQVYALSDSMKIQLRKTTVPFFVNYR